MRSFRFLVAPLGLLLLGADAPPPAAPPGMHATLPLSEYQRLRDLDERPGATVVEALRLGGSFKARDLWLTIEGRAAGRMPSRPVLTVPAGLRIYSCQGDGLLTRGEGGVFDLLPLAARFRIGCRLAVSGSDRLQMEASPHVLYVESQIKDGEYVGTDDASGRRSLSIVRQSGGGEVVRPAATARYLVSLLPEETRFRYQLDLRNPNRSYQPFVVELKGGEHVQQVDAQAAYEVDGPRYKFQLPPGELSLSLSGTLKQSRVAPPIDASVQYVLLESHPLLRPQVAGSAKRISASETGLTAQFRGAQGFLLSGKEVLDFTVTRLEALRTTSFAVRSARHVFFLSADGKALGESLLQIDNQGSPDLSLPMRAEPTFASLGGEPTFLTRSDSGHLWLPLSQGAQTVLVQHRQALATWMGLSTAELWLPQLKAPATTAHIELRTPREWVPLYAELSPESRLSAFSLWDLLCLLALFVWTERVLSGLGLSRGRRVLLSALLSGAAMLSMPLLASVCTGDAALTVAWLWPHLRRARWTFARVFGLFFVGGSLLLISAAMMSLSRSPSSDSYTSSEGDVLVSRKESKLGRGEAGDLPAAQDQAPDAAAANYQGLPAKFDMPQGARQIRFDREMLATEAPRAAYVVLVTRRVLAASGAILALLAALLLLAQRRALASGWRRMLDREV